MSTGVGTPAMRYVAFGLLVCVVAVFVAHSTHFEFINDDAFISFRYADNLVRHGELTFNVGERVEGYTNFSWTILMAAVIALGGDPVWWSLAVGVGLSCGTLVVVFLFGRWWVTTLSPEVRDVRSSLWVVVAPALLAMSSPFAAWSEGGLETALFSLLVTSGIFAYIVEEAEEPRWAVSGAIFAVAAATRPEGLLVFGLVGLHSVARQVVVDRALRPATRRIVSLASFGGLYGPYWIWRYVYYGFPLPNTYYAKGEGALWGPGLDYVFGFVSDSYLWVVALLLFVRWPGAKREGLLLSVVGIVVVPYLVYVARVGGDFMALYRFLVPILPITMFVGQEALAGLWTRASMLSSSAGAAFKVRGALAGLALLVLFGVHNARLTETSLEVGSVAGVDSIGWLKQFVEQTSAIGHHLAANRPPNTTIATTAAGVIPYYSRMKTLDLLCLNDTRTAHSVPARGGRPGHAKSAPEDYVLRWGPDILLWHPRLSAHRPRPRPGEKRYWADRGYQFGYAKVEGLEPPYWAYFEKMPPR